MASLIWIRAAADFRLRQLAQRVALHLTELGATFEPVPPEALRLDVLRLVDAGSDALDDLLAGVLVPPPFDFEIVAIESSDGLPRHVVARIEQVPPLVMLQRRLASRARALGLHVDADFEPQSWSPFIALALDVRPLDLALPRFRFEPFRVGVQQLRAGAEAEANAAGIPTAVPVHFAPPAFPEGA